MVDVVVDRRVEINCLARFRFSVLDMDGVVIAALLPVLLLVGVFLSTGVAGITTTTSSDGVFVMWTIPTGASPLIEGVGMLLLFLVSIFWAGVVDGGISRFFVLRIFPRGINNAVDDNINDVRSMFKVGRCDGTDDERVTVAVDDIFPPVVVVSFCFLFTGGTFFFRAK